jgi:hypothetical protein
VVRTLVRIVGRQERQSTFPHTVTGTPPTSGRTGRRAPAANPEAPISARKTLTSRVPLRTNWAIHSVWHIRIAAGSAYQLHYWDEVHLGRALRDQFP